MVGFARSNLTVASLRDRVTPHVSFRNEQERAKYELFWQTQVHYRRGQTTKVSEYRKLNRFLTTLEANCTTSNRLFYFALPPHVYVDVAKAVHNTSLSKR